MGGAVRTQNGKRKTRCYRVIRLLRREKKVGNEMDGEKGGSQVKRQR